MRKVFSVQSLLWLALVLALVGSLRHVAWGFGTLEQGDLYAGYIQAVAVDIGLFALAIGIQQRRRQARSTVTLWLGAALFSGVSTYVNLLHGLVFASDIGLNGWYWLVSARPFILSGVPPMLVVYLSEVAASDANHAIAEAERERQKGATTVVLSSEAGASHAEPGTLALVRLTRRHNAAQAISALLAFYAGHPLATQAEAGAAVERSRQWVSAQLAQLEKVGVISRNGSGVVVAQR